MSEQFCPECGNKMIYEAPVRRFVCRGCGLYATRDEISDIRQKAKTPLLDDERKKKKERGEYLQWWLSSKK
ncbi:MAG: hypothetical protein HYU39_02350 [Thaumarchaeota archaeon]|nr:hypothetical protein [Nitrososphaerota archaeon]